MILSNRDCNLTGRKDYIYFTSVFFFITVFLGFFFHFCGGSFVLCQVLLIAVRSRCLILLIENDFAIWDSFYMVFFCIK